MSGPGDAGLFVGWCFPVFFFGGGGVGPVLGSAPPPPFFVCGVFGGCGVTPRFLCVYGVLAVKGSQRHACR